MFAIENGVPLPSRREAGMKGFMKGLQVGQSFVAPKDKQGSIHAASAAIRNAVPNFGISTRSISDDEIRVWRTA